MDQFLLICGLFVFAGAILWSMHQSFRPPPNPYKRTFWQQLRSRYDINQEASNEVEQEENWEFNIPGPDLRIGNEVPWESLPSITTIVAVIGLQGVYGLKKEDGCFLAVLRNSDGGCSETDVNEDPPPENQKLRVVALIKKRGP